MPQGQRPLSKTGLHSKYNKWEFIVKEQGGESLDAVNKDKPSKIRGRIWLKWTSGFLLKAVESEKMLRVGVEES